MRRVLLLGVVLFLVLSTAGVAKEIALSFDDAPYRDGEIFKGLERTRVLIDRLREAKVDQAVIFVIAARAMTRDGRRRIEQFAQAGHVIANHSYSHFDLDKTPTKKYIDDIRKAHEALKGYSTFAKWYRFPMLHEGKKIRVRDAVRKALKNMGYQHGYVTVDSYDWYMAKLFRDALKAGKQVNYEKLKNLYVDTLVSGVNFYDEIGRRALGRSPRHMLLLHENDLAALFVKELVGKLRSEGWKIVSPHKAYEDPIAAVLPQTLLNGQGRVAAIAKTKGYKEPFVHPSEDEKYLEKLFKKEKIVF